MLGVGRGDAGSVVKNADAIGQQVDHDMRRACLGRVPKEVSQDLAQQLRVGVNGGGLAGHFHTHREAQVGHDPPTAALGLLLGVNLGGCDAGTIFGANGLFGGSASSAKSSGGASDGDGEANDDEQDGVDCVDGIDAATGAECDGGPGANQDDGEEGEDAETADDQGDGDGDCEDGVDQNGDPCTDDDTADTGDGDGETND